MKVKQQNVHVSHSSYAVSTFSKAKQHYLIQNELKVDVYIYVASMGDYSRNTFVYSETRLRGKFDTRKLTFIDL